MPSVFIVALYLVLLVTPLPLPFLSGPVRALVLSSLGPNSRLELGEMALALEHGTIPVVRFAPVLYTDVKSGAKVGMDALEVGFSPLRAIVGQPGASITIVGAHLQMHQDLFGPRLASFDVVSDPDGGPATVRVQEGEDAFPTVNIREGGLDVAGALPASLGSAGLRSDNEWLIYNFEAMELGLGDVVQQAQEGRFSRFVIRDATLDMNDAVYGLLRQFTDIELDLRPSADNKRIEGTFAAALAGRVMSGTVTRIAMPEGGSRVSTTMSNIDFVSLAAFVEDPASPIALSGQGAVSMDIAFDPAGKVSSGLFRFDLSGTDLRFEDTYFPVLSSIIEVDWTPSNGQFDMKEADLRVGDSTAKLSGVFRMGLDDAFGPTVGMAIRARDVVIHPSDLDAPSTPISELSFTGWSAPLYGAMGIDQLVIDKADGKIAATGRIDTVHEGMGFDITIAGGGVSADDVKRFWPSLFAPEARKWVIDSVLDGAITRANMRFNFPVGTIAAEGEPDKPIPPGALSIDLVGEGITIRPMPTMDPLLLEGETRFTMRDADMTLSAQGATIATESGPIAVRNAAMVMGSEGAPGESVLEISGDVVSGLPALLAFAEKQQPDALKSLTSGPMPIDPKALEGNLNVAMVATVGLKPDGQAPDVDFAINGRATGVGSKDPIQGFMLNGGELAFTASQEGYQVRGQAALQGIEANFSVGGKLEGTPEIAITSTIGADDLKKLGFDAGEFLSGKVQLTATPSLDGTLKVALDLKDAGLTIKDLGISKSRGTAGKLEAMVKQTGDVAEISDVALSFGDVSLKGNVAFDAKQGVLQKAEFSQLALSPGDKAQLSMAPIKGGYAVRISGAQLDLKPMFGRFFSLSGGSGSPQATVTNDAIQLDVKLDRALGFYKTTAFNVDLDLALKGSDLQRVNLQAQLGGGRSVSITTNPTAGGKVMSVALNDLGALLRLLGVYPRVEGGSGTLVMRTDNAGKYDVGEFRLANFALVDEDKVSELLDGAGRRSGSGRMNFDSAQVGFVRRSDRIELQKAVLAGDTIGGTATGFIYTGKGEYDLTGTFVPLFGINSALSKMPLLGPLLTGRDGAGMFGITFAVRGPLDKPDFQMNPASLLAPGAFRELFEYRSRERPRAGD